MKAISSLKQLIETTEQAESFFNSALIEIMNGDHDILEIYRLIRLNKDVLEAILKNDEFISLVENEIDKYGKKAELNDSILGIRQKPSYDYSVCNDSEYNKLVKKRNKINEKIKERENFLKQIDSNIDIANADTGELLMPPAKKTTTSIYFKLK